MKSPMVRGPFQEVQVVLNRVLLAFHQGWIICLGLRVLRGVRGFGGQDVSAGSFQQGFLTSDPWAN